jgi:hypothetical protein
MSTSTKRFCDFQCQVFPSHGRYHVIRILPDETGVQSVVAAFEQFICELADTHDVDGWAPDVEGGIIVLLKAKGD